MLKTVTRGPLQDAIRAVVERSCAVSKLCDWSIRSRVANVVELVSVAGSRRRSGTDFLSELLQYPNRQLLWRQSLRVGATVLDRCRIDVELATLDYRELPVDVVVVWCAVLCPAFRSSSKQSAFLIRQRDVSEEDMHLFLMTM